MKRSTSPSTSKKPAKTSVKKQASKTAKKPVKPVASAAAPKKPAKTPKQPAKVTTRQKQVKQPVKPAKPTHPKAKITFRHNVLPPIMGVLMFLAVLGFLNGQWVAAQVQYYVMPLHTKSRGVVPKLNLDPNAAPRLVIPSVGIDVPYITDEPSFAEDKVQLALRKGVAHFGTTAMPGQIGNMVVLGHSSAAIWESGSYKFAFTLLNKVPDGALVYVDYKGERYIYRLTSREVVEPEDVGVIDQSTDTPDITLITCTPIGVSSHRLVLKGTQISPSPAKATRANAPAGIGTATALPR